MQIKYLTKKMKISNIVMPLVWALLASAWVHIPMFLTGNFNLIKFITSAEDPFLMFSLILFTIIGPLVGFGFAVKAYFERKTEFANLYLDIHLKEVNLLENIVNFSFFRSEYNFSCEYKDIEKVKLTVTTSRHSTKNGYYYTVDDYIYEFTVLNGKTFEIIEPAPAVCKMKKIYNFLDLTNSKVGKFEFEAIGNGKTVELKEKVKFYSKNGCVKNIGKSELTEAKIASVLSFVVITAISFFIKELFTLVTASDKLLSIFYMALILLVYYISLWNDLLLHLDYAQSIDSKKNEYKILGLKPWQVFVVKILLIFEIFHLLFA